jgi:hypothetical protein
VKKNEPLTFFCVMKSALTRPTSDFRETELFRNDGARSASTLDIGTVCVTIKHDRSARIPERRWAQSVRRLVRAAE